MDRLPPELLSIIVSDVLRPDDDVSATATPKASSYACVCKLWQHIVERHTFRRIKLLSNELDQFSQVFNGPRRRAILQNLDYKVLLPPYSAARCAKFETRKEKKENNIAFTGAIRELLALLRGWEDADSAANRQSGIGASRPMRLNLSIYSPMDQGHRTCDVDIDLGTDRFEGNFLEFVPMPGHHDNDNDSLVKIDRITNFWYESTRTPHPTALCKLLAALPKLESLDMHIMQPKMKRLEVRRDHRCCTSWQCFTYDPANVVSLALARGLSALNFASLRRLRLEYEGSEPANHDFATGDLRELGSSVDSLNNALRGLSQSAPLTELILDGLWLVSPALFWPPDNAAGLSKDTPHWPTLKYLEVEASITTPDGHSYYTGDPSSETINEDELFTGSDAEDEPEDDPDDSDDSTNSDTADWFNDRREAILNGDAPTYPWRKDLDPTYFDPLLAAMARAVLRMPALRLARLKMVWNSTVLDCREVDVECLGSGEPSELRGEAFWDAGRNEREMREQGSRRWRVWLGSKLNWNPTVEIESLWKEFTGEEGTARVDVWL
ncbi:hypothetical protein PRK78_004684 [Emydomyces testavorans]|uniref:F-box domain-containing protein n=1 Tax=Emydomyces testavorans TaxID=2070801 RepID=A0AAF0IIU2_9EURO|nr:hypothetical protein PRK78_004684 [Emydomyces testavorans]